MNTSANFPSKDDIVAFLKDVFPQMDDQFVVQTVDDRGATLKLSVQGQHLRPGNTVSGPAMFALADVTMYVAVLGRIGLQPLAVTVNCSMDFMRRPAAHADMICRVDLLKVGRTLAVGNALLYCENHHDPVARGSFTFSIPPQRTSP